MTSQPEAARVAIARGRPSRHVSPRVTTAHAHTSRHAEWLDFPCDRNGHSHERARRRWDLADDPRLRYGQLRAFDRAMRLAEAEGGWLGAPAPRAVAARRVGRCRHAEEAATRRDAREGRAGDGGGGDKGGRRVGHGVDGDENGGDDDDEGEGGEGGEGAAGAAGVGGAAGRCCVCAARQLLWFARAQSLFVFHFHPSRALDAELADCGLLPLPPPPGLARPELLARGGGHGGGGGGGAVGPPIVPTLSTDDEAFGGGGRAATARPLARAWHVRMPPLSACVFAVL